MMRRAGHSEHENGFKGVSFREMDHESESLVVVQFKARRMVAGSTVLADRGSVELHVEETRGGVGTKRGRAKNIRFVYSAEAWDELKRLINEAGA